VNPKLIATDLAAAVDKVAAYLRDNGPLPTAEEIRAAHQALDMAQAAGVTAADVRVYRKGI
jgi:hypothetical protein